MNKAQPAAQTKPNALVDVRSFVWSIRREFWEHRSLYIAPFAIALIGLAGYLYVLFNTFGVTGRFGRETLAMQRSILFVPVSAVTFAIIATATLATFYFTLDALFGERRDRSILFWKSLPLSDRHAVLAKFAVPMLAMPLIEFVIIFFTQLAMLIAAGIALSLSGVGTEFIWKHFPFAKMAAGVVYGLVTAALWYAPVYAWFLFISGWARRGPVLWAVVPVIAAMLVERFTLGSTLVYDLIQRRILAGTSASFTEKSAAASTQGGDARVVVERLGETSSSLTPDPAKFFSNPELWIGLLLAVVFVIAAIQRRRNRGPI